MYEYLGPKLLGPGCSGYALTSPKFKNIKTFGTEENKGEKRNYHDVNA
jgi:hypothetical protein